MSALIVESLGTPPYLHPLIMMVGVPDNPSLFAVWNPRSTDESDRADEIHSAN